MTSDQEYPVSWIIVGSLIGCCNFLAFASSLFAFQTLIRNSSIRKNAYNVYVIFMIFPDGLQNLFAVFWNVFPHRFPQGFYEINVFVWFFYFLSNFYLNSVVAYEINKLVTANYRRQKTRPPKLERAWRQVAMVYLFATVISLWVVLPYKWSIMDIEDGPNGIVKFGSPNGGVFGPMVAPLIGLGLVGIPITYVLYIRIRIALRKLLPKRGRTRVLSLFFMRIIIVFLLFYLPNTVLNASLVFLPDNPVVDFWTTNFVAPLLNAFQAYVTLYMVLLKEDIREAIATAWNDSFGKRCCQMVTTVPKGPSTGPSKLTWHNSNDTPCSSRPSSLSASYRTESTLMPKKSEWDEDDVYTEREPDPVTRSEWDNSKTHGISEETKQEESRIETIEESRPGQTCSPEGGSHNIA